MSKRHSSRPDHRRRVPGGRYRSVLRLESLEPRQMMAGDAPGIVFSDWHNESNPPDVNGDGKVTAVDALITINALSRFEQVSVAEIQSGLYASGSAAEELYGGYHPDVDSSGTLTALDALRTINQLIRVPSDSNDVPISVIPDAQGSPLRIVYTAADGRAKEIDISELDLRIDWSDGDVIATDSNDEIVVIARPGVGTLEVDNSLEDGKAIVTRFNADGSQVTEQYVCIPGAVWDSELDIIRTIPPSDVRRPISGFEEVLGAMVEHQTEHAGGYEIVRHYEEAAAPNLISVVATLSSGTSMTVNLQDATMGTQLIVVGTNETGESITQGLESFEADLVYLLQLGYQPFETVTPSEVRAAVDAERAG